MLVHIYLTCIYRVPQVYIITKCFNVISEIKEYCQVRNLIYGVIAGDLNIDLGRLQSRNTLHLTEFANEEDIGLKCSNISCTFCNQMEYCEQFTHILFYF